MDVSVIIITYNSSDVIRPCLDALAAQRFDGACEVIVVDNASVDGTPDVVRREYPDVRLLAQTDNLGYSRGVNAGIRAARGRYFFILNPDTVVRPDAVQRLFDYAEAHPEAGIVGPRLEFHDGSVQYSCRRFYTLRVLLLRRTPLGRLFPRSRAVREHLMEDFDHASTRPVDWILGAAMFVRRDAVERVGAMDERFFLYFEDVDWCYRMHQAGLRVVYHADAVVTHGYRRESAQRVLNRSFVAHLVSLFRYWEKWDRMIYGLKRYREIAKVLVFLAVDLVAFNAAFASGYTLRSALGDVFPNPLFPMSAYGQFVLFENLLFVSAYAALGLYRIRRETRPAEEFFDIARAIGLAAVLLMTSTYLGKIRTYSRMVVVFVVGFSVLYDWLLRSALRLAHRQLVVHQVDLRRILVVAPAAAAREFETALAQDVRLGTDVVGIVEPERVRRPGGVDALEELVDRHRVQQVVVFDGAVDSRTLAAIVAMGQRRVIDVAVVSDLAAFVSRRTMATRLGERPALVAPRDARRAMARVLARGVDVALGLVFAVASVPGGVVQWIRALSRRRRPVAARACVGPKGTPVSIPTAGDPESPDGPSDFVNPPLFWNVVRGRLSLVGPMPVDASTARAMGEAAAVRRGMRPGVTGPWRMLDRRTVTLDELVALDARLLVDSGLDARLRVLVATLPRMIRGRARFLRVVADPETARAEGAPSRTASGPSTNGDRAVGPGEGSP